MCEPISCHHQQCHAYPPPLILQPPHFIKHLSTFPSSLSLACSHVPSAHGLHILHRVQILRDCGVISLELPDSCRDRSGQDAESFAGARCRVDEGEGLSAAWAACHWAITASWRFHFSKESVLSECTASHPDAVENDGSDGSLSTMSSSKKVQQDVYEHRVVVFSRTTAVLRLIEHKVCWRACTGNGAGVRVAHRGRGAEAGMVGHLCAPSTDQCIVCFAIIQYFMQKK